MQKKPILVAIAVIAILGVRYFVPLESPVQFYKEWKQRNALQTIAAETGQKIQTPGEDIKTTAKRGWLQAYAPCTLLKIPPDELVKRLDKIEFPKELVPTGANVVHNVFSGVSLDWSLRRNGQPLGQLIAIVTGNQDGTTCANMMFVTYDYAALEEATAKFDKVAPPTLYMLSYAIENINATIEGRAFDLQNVKKAVGSS